jgi:hypothetical protein
MADPSEPTARPLSNVLAFPTRVERARTASREKYRKERASEDENPWRVALALFRKERGEE